jgi:hypothetical protein
MAGNAGTGPKPRLPPEGLHESLAKKLICQSIIAVYGLNGHPVKSLDLFFFDISALQAGLPNTRMLSFGYTTSLRTSRRTNWQRHLQQSRCGASLV